MFPTVRITFSGALFGDHRDLASNGGNRVRYFVLLDVVPVDGKRYRYAYHRSSWLVAGKADPPAPARLYTHPDSPFTPDQLRKQVISFEKVKLTNNEMDKQGQVRSIHSFEPFHLAVPNSNYVDHVHRFQKQIRAQFQIPSLARLLNWPTCSDNAGV